MEVASRQDVASEFPWTRQPGSRVRCRRGIVVDPSDARLGADQRTRRERTAPRAAVKVAGLRSESSPNPGRVGEAPASFNADYPLRDRSLATPLNRGGMGLM